VAAKHQRIAAAAAQSNDEEAAKVATAAAARAAVRAAGVASACPRYKCSCDAVRFDSCSARDVARLRVLLARRASPPSPPRSPTEHYLILILSLSLSYPSPPRSPTEHYHIAFPLVSAVLHKVGALRALRPSLERGEDDDEDEEGGGAEQEGLLEGPDGGEGTGARGRAEDGRASSSLREGRPGAADADGAAPPCSSAAAAAALGCGGAEGAGGGGGGLGLDLGKMDLTQWAAQVCE
jgi:hypothetical protein